MTKLIAALILTLLFNVATAQNGLEKIIVEKFYVSDVNDTSVNSLGGPLPVGSVTYRFYVDMLPGYTFQAAYGVDVAPTGTVNPGDHELRFETSTLFFNNVDRGATSPTFTFNRLDDNTVMLDSWLSVGAACSGYYGVLKSEDDSVNTVVNSDGVLQNADTSAGIPLSEQDGVIAGAPQAVTPVGITAEIEIFNDQNDGPLFSTYNGSWACLGGCEGPDTSQNVLLIAQITTDGILTYELNIQIGTPTGGVQNYVAKDPQGAEIVLPGLMDTLGLPDVNVNTPPSISITSPANDDSLGIGDTLMVSVSATDADGTVDSVELFVSGSKTGVAFAPPYDFEIISTNAGIFNLTATATDNDGLQNTSTPVMITVLLVGIDEISQLADLTVFPSPVVNTLELRITPKSHIDKLEYRLYDLHGKVLSNKTISPGSTTINEKIDVSDLAQGQYILEISADGKSSVRKIIKN